MDLWDSVFVGQYALSTFGTWQLNPSYTFIFLFFTITSLSHAIWPQIVSVLRCLNMIIHSSLNVLRPRGYFNHYWPNIVLSSTTLFVFPQVQCRAQTTHYFTALCWFFLSSCGIMAAFEIRNSEIFWKINLDQAVRIRDNNLDCKCLIRNVELLTLCLRNIIK